MSITLDGWKALSMGVFTAVSILGAWLAVVMKERAKQVYVTSGVLFSAGVLLAGGFVHLLFDCHEQFEELDITNFQWAFAIAGLTIILLNCLEFALERVIDNKIMNHHQQPSKLKRRSSDEHRHHHLPQKMQMMAVAGKALEQQNQTTSFSYICKDGEDSSSSEEHEVLLQHYDDNNDEHGQNNQGSHNHNVHLHIIDAAKPLSSILLTIALSIHSILEGIGIGTTNSVSTLQTEFIAVLFHKGFTAFALGNQLISSGYWTDKRKRKYFFLSIGIFIGVALLGICIGWAISNATSDGLASAIFVGITSGSFIFVAALEIIPGEARIIKEERLSVLPVVVCFIAGYILMSMLALWT